MQLKIKWTDRLAHEGGGTDLVAHQNGDEVIPPTGHYPADCIEDARNAAVEFLRKARFGNAPDQRPNV